MYWSRFDICAAYYHYACIAKSYYTCARIDRQLTRLGYRPALSEQRLSGLSSNAKQIYMRLVREEFKR